MLRRQLESELTGVRRIEYLPFVVDRAATVKEALGKINQNRGYPCVISDESNRCFGLITDGDIRRFLLAGNQLDDPVSNLEGPFFSVPPSATRDDAVANLSSKQIRFLPIISEVGEIMGIWSSEDGQSEDTFLQPVLILAGGKGTRLKPLTLSIPKPLIKVGNSTLLDRTLEKCVSDGFSNIFVSVNYLREKVMKHLEGYGLESASISVIEEEEPLGTAGPVGLLPPSSKGDLLVVNADVIHNVNLGKMMATHLHSNASMTVAVRPFQTTIPFGVVEVEGSRIMRVTEKPTLTFPVNAGIYILSQEVRDLVHKGDPIDMPDLIQMALIKGMPVASFLVHEYWLDVGTPENLAIAQAEVDEWSL